MTETTSTYSPAPQGVTLHVEPHGEPLPDMEVVVTRSEIDQRPLVMIDTAAGLRVMVNDGAVFDAPDLDQTPTYGDAQMSVQELTAMLTDAACRLVAAGSSGVQAMQAVSDAVQVPFDYCDRPMMESQLGRAMTDTEWAGVWASCQRNTYLDDDSASYTDAVSRWVWERLKDAEVE